MGNGQFILEGHTPVEVHDIGQWGEFMKQHKVRRVAWDELPGNVRVSTVFLGLDHNFQDDGPPILFETMIFGGRHNDYQARYATWEEAEVGHAKALKLARGNWLQRLRPWWRIFKAFRN